MGKTVININKTGDINAVLAHLQNFPKKLDEALQQGFMQVAAKGEQIVVKHLKNQDLQWLPLKKATIAAKKRKGHSNKKLIATTSMMQSITSMTVGNYSFIGVRRGSIHSETGEQLANIAAVHEYGSEARNIKPRKLWKPSMLELKKYVQESGVFVKAIKKAASK